MKEPVSNLSNYQRANNIGVAELKAIYYLYINLTKYRNKIIIISLLKGKVVSNRNDVFLDF